MRVFFAYLLYPFSVLYSIVIYFRNKFYDYGLFKSYSHNITTIGVGNLRVGGTGKTPHIEYLIELLSQYYNIAVISRGYGRKTKGFRFVDIEKDSPLTVGDEPLQMKRKFPIIPFAVCENRNKGIEELEKTEKDLEIILLDDVFQHRALNLDISLLLTEYSNPFFKDKILPFGLLREQRKGYKRADYIIITKSPDIYTMEDKLEFEAKIKPKKYQKVFFSNIIYKPLYHLFDNSNSVNLDNHSIFLITAIANNSAIVEYINSNSKLVDIISFSDHYNFTKKDIDKIISSFDAKKMEDSIILTTQKDAVRLIGFEELKPLPIYVLPIELNIISSSNKTISLKDKILYDVRKDKSYSRVHKS